MQGRPQTQLYGLHWKDLTQLLRQPFSHCVNNVVQSSHALGHHVVTPSQVTCPRSPAAQLRSAPEQLVVPRLLLQLMLVLPQLAVTVQREFVATNRGWAASSGAGVTSRAASVARNASSPALSIGAS